jgi:hypothetical protein
MRGKPRRVYTKTVDVGNAKVESLQRRKIFRTALSRRTLDRTQKCSRITGDILFIAWDSSLTNACQFCQDLMTDPMTDPFSQPLGFLQSIFTFVLSCEAKVF